jgi:hypothetical protein
MRTACSVNQIYLNLIIVKVDCLMQSIKYEVLQIFFLNLFVRDILICYCRRYPQKLNAATFKSIY